MIRTVTNAFHLDFANYTLLLVDDDPASLETLGASLEAEGFEIIVATDGALALERAVHGRPDLILLDVLMPGLDGFEICRRLKANEATQHIPVIFLTALGEPEDKVKGFAAGGVDYIVKPLQHEEVLARVKTHLSLHAAQTQLEAQNAQLLQEIAERQRAEEESRRLNAELEQRVAVRTAELRAANAHLRAEIEERKRVEAALRESEERYHEIFQSAAASIWEEDFSAVKMAIDELKARGVADIRQHLREHPDFVRQTAELVAILDVNDATLKLLGATHKRDLLSSLSRTLSPAMIQKIFTEELCAIAEGRRDFEAEEVIQTFQGELRTILLKITFPRQDARFNRVLVSIMDITRLKQAEEQLRRLNEELESRVSARTAELRESLETLQRTQAQLVRSEKMAALGGLVAGVAHEINTPLGVGITAASHLADQTLEIKLRYQQHAMTRADLENYVQLIQEAAGIILSNLQRAAGLIQSFKQVAVDQTSEEKRRFKLKGYLEGVLLSLRPKLKKTPHTVTLTCPETLELESYPGAFSQILTNFIMNSLEHGLAADLPGTIALEIDAEHNTLRFRYRDNGKGMPPQERTHIFEPFYTTKRGQGGSGLGLHIVYNLVTQRLHGQIECQSAPGAGTTFLIQMPIKD